MKKPEIKAVVQQNMKDSRMTSDEVIARLEAMALGEIPTKTTETPSRTYGSPTVKAEYDVISAIDKMGKIYALFVDKQIVQNIGLEIIDDDQED